MQGIVERTLSNGLRILCLKKKGAPVVAVQIWYKVGSAYETSGQHGISHFLEHLMFRGSANVPSEEHSRRINDIGGHCNAFTAEDVTAYTNCVPNDYVDLVLSMEADRMQGLLFDPQIFETERRVIIEEYHTYMNNPVTKAFLEFRSAFFDAHPYAYSPLGTLEDVSQVPIEVCRSYHQTWYIPSNALVVVVGDIDSEESVCDRIAVHFGAISDPRANTVSPRPSPQHPVGTTGWMQRCIDFDVPILVVGYPVCAASHPDAVPLEILQMILSQGETGRLHRRLVRSSSLAVMASGVNQLLQMSGMSLLFALFTPDVSVKKLYQAMMAEVASVCSGGVDQSEMTKIRNATLTSRCFELYTAEHICQRLGYAQLVEGDYRQWVERQRALQCVTADDIVDVARRYWNESTQSVLHLKPRRIKPLVVLAGLMRRILPRKS